ncbi:hypothetical protein IWQ60_003639 [Tieghemiomyces parasiticus]|uniref:PH domain-containing protein n=1 Tax=Tieghemiomyces parasiticus TaxID=78921 RepID=A0A9W8A9Y9_9FUNG|nr:hypothetical protein IWQ60_003639 [Tieghemiomyces parasiticus]
MVQDFSEFGFADSFVPPPTSPSANYHSLPPSTPGPGRRRVADYGDGYDSDALPDEVRNPPPKRRSILPQQVLAHQSLHHHHLQPPARPSGQGRHHDPFGHPVSPDDDLLPSGTRPRPVSDHGRHLSRWDGHHPQTSAASFRSHVSGRSRLNSSTPSIRQVVGSRSRLHLPRQPVRRVIHPAVHHNHMGAEAVQAPVLRVFIGPLTPDWMTFSLKRRWRAYAPREGAGDAPGADTFTLGDAGSRSIAGGSGRGGGGGYHASIPYLREPTIAPDGTDDRHSGEDGYTSGEGGAGGPVPGSVTARSLITPSLRSHGSAPHLRSYRSTHTMHTQTSQRGGPARSFATTNVSLYHTPLATTAPSRTESFHTAHDAFSVRTGVSYGESYAGHIATPRSPLSIARDSLHHGARVRDLEDSFGRSPAVHEETEDDDDDDNNSKSNYNSRRGHNRTQPNPARTPQPIDLAPLSFSQLTTQLPTAATQRERTVAAAESHLAAVHDEMERPLQRSGHETLLLTRVAPVALRRDYCRPEVAMMHYNEYTASKCRIISEKWKHVTAMVRPGEINFFRGSATKPLFTIYLSSRTRLSLFSSLDNSLAITYFEEDSDQRAQHHYRRSIRRYYRTHQAQSIAHRRSGHDASMELKMSIYSQDTAARAGASRSNVTDLREAGSGSAFRLNNLLHQSRRVRPKALRRRKQTHHAEPDRATAASDRNLGACILRFPTAAEAKVWYRILHCHIIHVIPIPRAVDLTCPTLSASPFRSINVEIPLAAVPVAAEPSHHGVVPQTATFDIIGPRTVWDVRTMAAFELIVESEWGDQLAAWVRAKSLAVCWKRFDRIDWCFSNLSDGWDEHERQLILEAHRIAQLVDGEDEDGGGAGSDSDSSRDERALRDRNTRLNMRTAFQPSVTALQSLPFLSETAPYRPSENASSYFDDIISTSAGSSRGPYPPGGRGPGTTLQPASHHPLAVSPHLNRTRPRGPTKNSDVVSQSHLSLESRGSGLRNQRLADIRDRLSTRSEAGSWGVGLSRTPSVHAPCLARGDTAESTELSRAMRPVRPENLRYAENVADHPLLSTQFIEQTHQMQLRENYHYPDAVVLSAGPGSHHSGVELPEPNPLEGYLLRRPKPHTYLGQYRQMFVMTFDHHLICVSSYRAKQYIEANLTDPAHHLTWEPPHHQPLDPRGWPDASFGPSTASSRHHPTSHRPGATEEPKRSRSLKDRLRRPDAERDAMLRQQHNPYANDVTVNAADFVLPSSVRARRQLHATTVNAGNLPDSVLPASGVPRPVAAVPLTPYQQTLTGVFKGGDGDGSGGHPSHRSRTSLHPGAIPHDDALRLHRAGTAPAPAASLRTGPSATSGVPYQYHYSTHARLARMLRHAGGFFDITQIKYIYPVSAAGGPLPPADGISLLPATENGSHSEVSGHPYSAASSMFPDRRARGMLARLRDAVTPWRRRGSGHTPETASHAPTSLFRPEGYPGDTDGYRYDRAAEVALRRETRFDIIMENGAILRLQAPTNATMREWIRRLIDLRTYWTGRLQADARHRAEAARVNVGLHINSLGCEGDLPGWEQPRTYADPLIWNICRPLGCRTVTMCGYLFRKKHRHAPLKRAYFILTRGYLIEFTPVQYASYSTVQPCALRPPVAPRSSGASGGRPGANSGSMLAPGHLAGGSTVTRDRRTSWQSGTGGLAASLLGTTGSGHHHHDEDGPYGAGLPGAPGRWAAHDNDHITRKYMRHQAAKARKQSSRHGFYPRVKVIPLQGCFTLSRVADNMVQHTADDLGKVRRIYPDNVLAGDAAKECVFTLWQPKKIPAMPLAATEYRVDRPCAHGHGTSPITGAGTTAHVTSGGGNAADLAGCLPCGRARSVNVSLGSGSHSITTTATTTGDDNESRHTEPGPFHAATSSMESTALLVAGGGNNGNHNASPARTHRASQATLAQPVDHPTRAAGKAPASGPSTGLNPAANRAAEGPFTAPQEPSAGNATKSATRTAVETLADQATRSFPHYLIPSLGKWSEKTYMFKARSRSEMEQWVSAINHEIERIQYQAEAMDKRI